MQGMRKSLAEAEVKAALGDPDAKDDVDYYRLSIKRQLRDQDSIRANATAALAKVRAIVRGAPA